APWSTRYGPSGMTPSPSWSPRSRSHRQKTRGSTKTSGSSRSRWSVTVTPGWFTTSNPQTPDNSGRRETSVEDVPVQTPERSGVGSGLGHDLGRDDRRHRCGRVDDDGLDGDPGGHQHH